MHDILNYTFMQNALIAGILIGFLASYFGVFVVQRKMSFLGSGLSHSAFGGVALGLLLNVEPLWVAIPFTIIVSILIVYLKEKTKIETDTSIGILFSVSVAIGIVLLSMRKNYSGDAYSYLFGSILSVSYNDLIAISILSLLAIITIYFKWADWAYSTFDSELSTSDKINVIRDDYILSILIAITIVVAMKIIGIILISAFLVIPAAAGKMISKTFFQMTLFSILIGVFSSIAGLFFSYIFDIPSGAAIILCQTLIFIVFAIIKRN